MYRRLSAKNFGHSPGHLHRKNGPLVQKEAPAKNEIGCIGRSLKIEPVVVHAKPGQMQLVIREAIAPKQLQ